MPFKFSVLAAA